MTDKKLIPTLKHLLCPPGTGVFTVHTARERKSALHQKMYGTGEQNEVQKKWQQSLNNIQDDRPALFGVCSDCGGGILRGANWGPLFLRQELLNNPTLPDYQDLGDVRVIPHLLHDKYLNDQTIQNCQKALYSEVNDLPVSPLSMTERALDDIYQEHPTLKVLGLGGDHSVSYPLVKSYLKKSKVLGKKAAIIHFDAHTDLLHERLGIDLCFGSWATHILDDLDSPDLLIQLGIRSSGKDRGHWEKKFSHQQYWTEEINRLGVEALGQQIKNHLLQKGVDELYISFDIDALDAAYASATGTPESGGLAPDQCISLIKILTEDIPLTGADLVEVAPFLATEEQSGPEPTTTLLSAQMILSVFLSKMHG